jgi:hypothetical protein
MRKVLIAALIGAVTAGAAFAQTPSSTPAPASKAATASKTTTAKPRTAASIECSKQADAKGLHGKEREKFRAQCKRELSKKS